MTFWLVQALNGISYGMLLFLLASGFSLIFGVMKILNLTHGSFYLLGGYLGLVVLQKTGSFILAVLGASLAIALIGVIIERFFLRRFHLQQLPQVLVTFGFLFIFSYIATVIWGANPQTMPRPSFFPARFNSPASIIRHTVSSSSDSDYSSRRSSGGFRMVLGLVRCFALASIMRKLPGLWESMSRFSSLWYSGLALSWPRSAELWAARSLVFIPERTLRSSLGFVVVIIGGLGSLKGALVGGLAVGLLDNFGKVFFPELALFTIFAPMALILAIRPAGLFGRE